MAETEQTGKTDSKTETAAGTPIPEDVRRALGYIGSIKTAKKSESSRRNGQEFGGRPQKALEDLTCNCGGEGLNHKTSCPRGRAIRRRQKAGQL